MGQLHLDIDSRCSASVLGRTSEPPTSNTGRPACVQVCYILCIRDLDQNQHTRIDRNDEGSSHQVVSL